MSIPIDASATIGDHADVAQLVERDLAKVEVAGSSPVVRSIEFPIPAQRAGMSISRDVSVDSSTRHDEAARAERRWSSLVVDSNL